MATRRRTRSSATDTGHARDYVGIALAYAKRAAADKKQVHHCRMVRLSEFEDFLREAGFSKSQAAAVASKGLSQLLRSESGSAPDAVKALRAAVDGFMKPAA